uniref:glycosyltransferase family 4 protein n=1 Tax=Pararhizobium sp. IMCC3301 TaxID=3067904 RepID=UPI0027415970|nr:glycosyltransferase family 4 protein [Pararhizobium sp. IMCC3301]
MKILLFVDDYPDETNLPGDMFAHTRARLYSERAQVLVLRRAKKSRRLAYEKIAIRDYVTSDEALAQVVEYQPDIAAVHFASEPFISELSPFLACPLIVWVHGFEALAWHRRRFDMQLSDWLPNRVLFRHMRSRQRLGSFAKLIDRSNAGNPIHFVFVSNWMKKVCEADTQRQVRCHSTIPNPIDVTRFVNSPFGPRRRNLLVIRSSRTLKYAPDIVANVVSNVIKQGNGNFSCRIFSDGALFDKYFAPLSRIDRIEVHRGFLSQEEIIEQHKWGGFFICPTRQDAQGVSMCEAMASGLIVATIPVTAIPEFISDEIAVLSKSAAGLVKGILEVAKDAQLEANMSQAAAAHISATLDASTIVERELRLMRRYAFNTAV